MNRSLERLVAKGFTLIELLIVVIIIAILAAIAIPQFANTTGDAQEGALDANLKTMRSAIELYRVQHRNVFPALVTSVPATASATACTTAGGVAGTGALNTEQAFIDQLTMFSDANGGTCSVAVPASGIALGPYLREIPQEQISNPPSRAVAVVTTVATDTAPTTATPGYRFNTATGRLIVNSNADGRRGMKYSAY